MPITSEKPQTPATIRTDLSAIFVSLELSSSTWLITSLSLGAGKKMSKHLVQVVHLLASSMVSEPSGEGAIPNGATISDHCDPRGRP